MTRDLEIIITPSEAQYHQLVRDLEFAENGPQAADRKRKSAVGRTA